MADDWPNPSKWVSDLAKRLRDLDVIFLTLEGVRSGRLKVTQDEIDRLQIDMPVGPDVPHQYTRVISSVIDALEQLPAFATGQGLVALRALRFDLDALDEGGIPDRLTPRVETSSGGANRGQRFSMAYMVAHVRLLEELDVRNKPAREFVAAAFKAQGFRVSPQSLFTWATKIDGAEPGEPYAFGRGVIDRELARWRADPAWPFAVPDAQQLITNAAAGATIFVAHTT